MRLKKNTELAESFIESAKSRNISLTLNSNADFICVLETSGVTAVASGKPFRKPDFVVFWDKDVRLAKNLENMGIRCFNASEAIEKCDDKSLTHQILSRNGIKMPKTIIAPKTFFGFDRENSDFLNLVSEQLLFPIVVKECFGSFGEQVYLAENFEELIDITIAKGKNSLLFQEFISSSRGRDIRAMVVGGAVVGAVERFSLTNDFRANSSMGGIMKNIKLTNSQNNAAINSCKILGLDFGGVDILFGANGEPVVCEVNSNSYVKNFSDETGLNVCGCILDYVEKTFSRY